MTGLFFVVSLFIGSLTYNLFRPIYQHSGLSVVSFVSGWLVGELALHHIVLQLFTVFLFALVGAIHGLLGALGLVLCVASWLSMGWFYLRSGAAKLQMQQALLMALGSHYETQIQDSQRAHFPIEPDFGKIKDPRHNIHPSVEVLKNVSFGQHGQKLDIYRARRELINRPVLLQIHGGAWTEKMGSKNEQAVPLMSHMAMRDWICVSIDYRLSPTATFPEHIIDCKEGLAWVKTHIHKYGGNPDFIIVTGGSAGGHLCSLLALTANDPVFQPGFEDIDTQVQGAVPFYGVYDLTDEHKLQKNTAQRKLFETSVLKIPLVGNSNQYKAGSPLFRVNSAAPPFLIIHGSKDSLVPVEEARMFAAKLKGVSEQPVAFAEISDAQHAFDMFPSLRSEHVKQGVERFLAYLYSQYLTKN
ncbi:MAG: acetyl esterase/lipase [Candidatus Azotimanducaceae bacterium]|jgi:acetyl esterase/lipase